MRRWSGVLVAVVAIFVLGFGLVGTVGADAPIKTASSDTSTTDAHDEEIHTIFELSQLPDDTDHFEARLTVAVPSQVTELVIWPDQDVKIESTDGFEQGADGTLEWDGSEEPKAVLTVPADETEYHGPEAAGDGYAFADTGEWGVVAVPGIDLQYATPEQEPVGTAQTVEVDGPGATGGEIAFFGEVSEYEREAAGETIRLVVPEAATLEESPTAVLDALEAASDGLTVGADNEEFFVVAVPNDGSVSWGPDGVQYGESNAWVVADAPLEDARNVWLHEYTHARQGFVSGEAEVADDIEWLIEGQADYYAALLALEQGLVEFDAFSMVLGQATSGPEGSGILAEPETWGDDQVDYVKGRLVYGELDRKLRVETDGDWTLEDVFRTLNQEREEVTAATFLDALEEAGGTALREQAETYTTTDAVPEMWDEADHEAAFDQPRATFEVGMGTEPMTVGADDNERSLEREEVVAVPVGEPISVPVTATNVGEQGGSDDVTLAIDGQIVDAERLSLEADATDETTLSWTPDEPGVYDVRVGSEETQVVVTTPASVDVTDVSVEPDRVDPDEDVTVSATAETSTDYPAATVLEFRTVDGVVAAEMVTVEPGEEETVETTLTFEETNRYEIAVDEETTTVTVGSRLDELPVPGFGAVGAVGAIAVVVALLARRS